METTTVETTEIKAPEIGKFKPKEKFIDFISFKRGMNLHINEAFVSGSQISSMEFEGKKFKLIIKDEGTVDFEAYDVDNLGIISNVIELSDSRKQNLLDMICHDGIVVPYRDRYVLENYRFDDKDGNQYYLCIEVKKPIDKLMDVFAEPVVTDSQKSKIDAIFGDDFFEEEKKEEAKEEKKEIVEEVKKTPTTSQEILSESFKKMKDEKILELQKRIDDAQKQKIGLENNLTQYEKNLREVKDDIRLTQNRLKSMTPKKDPNGFIFNVSEEIKTDVKLDENLKTVVEKISPLLKLKPEAVIEYLTRGKYFIRLSKVGDKDFKFDDKDIKEFIKNDISKDAVKSIDPLGNWGTDNDWGGRQVITYVGELKYHDLVEGMIKNGFETNHDFNMLFEKKVDATGKEYTMDREEKDQTKSPSLKDKASDLFKKIKGK